MLSDIRLLLTKCSRYVCAPCFSECPVVIMELADRGSLLDLLRKRRGLSQLVKDQKSRLDSVTSNSDISNSRGGFSKYSKMPNSEDLLKPGDMFNFSRQVARGMEFLSAKGVSDLLTPTNFSYQTV